MRIATWNVNSLKARLPRVEAWLAEIEPDVLAIQETKLADDHRLDGAEYPVMEVLGDRIVTKHVPALTALNERLRDDWITDVAAAIGLGQLPHLEAFTARRRERREAANGRGKGRSR